jgi:HNH endonuclease
MERSLADLSLLFDQPEPDRSLVHLGNRFGLPHYASEHLPWPQQSLGEFEKYTPSSSGRVGPVSQQGLRAFGADAYSAERGGQSLRSISRAAPSQLAHEYVQQAQWFAPLIFARPPVVLPRQLAPLEELPPGTANGPRAGMNFPRNFGRPSSPEEYPTCTYCREPTGPGNFHRDHIIPRSRGGDGSEQNYAPSCPGCNQSKGPRTPAEWYEWFQNGGI